MTDPHADHLSYYETRAHQERAAAETAATPEIASRHRFLAVEYEAEVRRILKGREALRRQEDAGRSPL
ncbi:MULTISPECIES: hypothetical protein [Sphingomonadaceae]|uniref:Uncharacterized protein n=2 Tax=Sphingobium TaxID=165695 RepID=A0A0S3EUF6_9SPHN|nr:MULTISPECIES: hypothetical protein [Sphingomonadaceae]ALR19062.1 hypothetical protein ATN00_00785 [Sphingobium baderi]PJG45017.1 hypothetical protein CAF53_25660 [Sphingobium sp. LB126]RXR25172.1 hypothetical protein EQG66_14545 [Sphingobium fluviale]